MRSSVPAPRAAPARATAHQYSATPSTATTTSSATTTPHTLPGRTSQSTAYALSYYDGRAAYSVLGAFNAYLEQPVAVWLLLTALPASATSLVVAQLRE